MIEERIQLAGGEPTSEFNAADAAVLAATAAPAEDVPAVGDAEQSMEDALLAATAKAKNPSTPNATARNAMDRLVGAFVTERDEAAKQDLLASASELAASSGESLQRLLDLALQPQQPADVQQQALYLAAGRDPATVAKIAADPHHPLQLEAEAFLRERRIAAGIRIPDKVTEPGVP